MTHHQMRRIAAVLTLLVCPALVGCANDPESPMPESPRAAPDAGGTSTPPGDDGTTPPGDDGTTPPVADAGTRTTPPPGDDGTPPDDGTTTPPSASDRELAERFADADGDAFAAGCRCHYTEWGFGSADECATEAMAAPDPAFVDCIASAFAGRASFGECVVSQAEAYASCAATEACGSGGTASTCEDSVPDCGDDAAAWAALDACYGDDAG